MNNILFKPWEGHNFGKSELGRLLIIGDSHYFLNDEDESVYPNWTQDIISDLESTNFKIFKNIGEIFYPNNHLELWSKVAFANAIQSAFRGSDQKPTEDDFKTVEPAIQEYLKMIKPDKIIVFSKRVWENGLKNDIDWGEYVDSIKDEKYGKESTVWKFNYEGGFCHGIGVNHPSSRGFSPAQWNPLITKFLENNYSNY
jgi:hypothetical protein